ncbi:MAG: nucleotidyltransferase domain-containing protein, partial [Gammaproteobacteria bacterium]
MKSSPSDAAPGNGLTPSLPVLGDYVAAHGGAAVAARHYVKASRDALTAAFAPGNTIKPLLRQISECVDAALSLLWTDCLGETPEAALIAVGGYGRGELFPQSDIDILILIERTPDDATASKLERFVTSLWDIGLQIGHSVRTLAECETLAAEDLTIITTMMEARHLSGNQSLLPALEALIAPSRMWAPNDFIRGKLTEQQNRHDRYSNTEYALEPNIKSSPGGLRDLQVIEWIT